MQKFFVETLKQSWVPRIPTEHDGDAALAKYKLTVKN